MSEYKNYKEEKCWSCEHYCANRRVTKDAFGKEFVATDGKGHCNKGETYFNGNDVPNNFHCGHYKRWTEIQKIIDKEYQVKQKDAQRREEQRLKRQQGQEQKQNNFEESITPYKDEPLFSSVSFPKISKEEERRIDRKIEEYEDKIKTCKIACLTTILVSPIASFFLFVIITWFSLTAGVYAGIVMLIIYGIEFLIVLIVYIARVKYLRYLIQKL